MTRRCQKAAFAFFFEECAFVASPAFGRLSALQFVLLICAAQVLIQIGAFVWPALLPDLVQRWAFSAEGGWPSIGCAEGAERSCSAARARAGAVRFSAGAA